MGPVWLVSSTCVVLLIAGLASLGWFLRGDPARGRRRCPRCWYDMAGVGSLTCPECGQTARSEQAQRRRHRRRGWAALALLLFVAAAVIFITDPICRRGWAGTPVAARLVAIPWCDLSDPRFQEPLSWAIAKGLSPFEQRLLARRLRVVMERASPDPTDRTLAAAIAQNAWSSGADMRSLRPALLALADDGDRDCASSATTAMSGIFFGDCTLTPTWTRLLTESPHAGVRANAAGALRGMQGVDPAAAAALLAALDDPDRTVVAQATVAAGVQRVPEAAPVLLELTHADDVSVRASALRGLREMGPHAAEVVPDLITALASQDDPLRGLIAEALGAIGGPARAALPALLDACHDEKPAVRGRAMIAVSRLAEPGDEQAVAAIVPALDSEAVSLQRVALEGLLRLRWIPSEQHRRRVESMRSAKDRSVRIWAQAVLMHDSPNVDPLIKAMLAALSGSHTEECVAAAEVLEALGPRAESALPELDRYDPAEPGVFSDPADWVRYQAARDARRAIRRDMERH